MRCDAVGILLCAFVAAAQPTPDARHILEQVAAAYTTVSGYQLEAVVTDRMSNGATPKPTTLAISYSAPDRLMLQDKSANRRTSYHDNGVGTSDGRGWVFTSQPPPPPPKSAPPFSSGAPTNPRAPLSMPAAIPPANPARKPLNSPAARSEALVKIGFNDYSSITEHLQSARVVRQEDFTLDGDTIPCSVIETTYPHNQKRTFWVDNARDVVLREVDLEPLAGPAKGASAEHSIEIVKLNWGEPPPNSIFELEPPRPATSPPGPLNRADAMRHHCDLTTPEARIAGLQGMVTLSVTIDVEGRPTDIQVVEPLGLGVDELAVECESQNLYRPGQRDGKPVPWKVRPSISVSADNNSGWNLRGVAFQPPPGATRPVFLKTNYPELARATGHAVFHLSLTIDKAGIPRNVQVTGSNDPQLDRKAVQIVSSWRFVPGRLNDQPIDIPATFDLGIGRGFYANMKRN